MICYVYCNFGIKKNLIYLDGIYKKYIMRVNNFIVILII